MTEAEDQRVIKLTVDAARGRARVIAGTGSNATSSAIEWSNTARDLGVDAVLVVAPYYNKPTQEGLYTHFRTVAEAVNNLPVVIYNVPGRTGCNIAAATTLRLAHEVENIVAIKEASGDLAQIMAILRGRPNHFRVLSGDDAVTLPLVALGADGLILSLQMKRLSLSREWSTWRLPATGKRRALCTTNCSR